MKSKEDERKNACSDKEQDTMNERTVDKSCSDNEMQSDCFYYVPCCCDCC